MRFLTHVKPQNVFHVDCNFKCKNEVIKFTSVENLRNDGMRNIFLHVIPEAEATRSKWFCLTRGNQNFSVLKGKNPKQNKKSVDKLRKKNSCNTHRKILLHKQL